MNRQSNIVIALCIVLFFSFLRIGSLSSEISDLKTDLAEIKSNVEGIYSKLSEEEESNKLVNSSSFSIRDIDNSKFTTTVDIKIELNRLDKNSYPVLAYKETSAQEWKEEKLEAKDGLSYEGSMVLDQAKGYEYKILTKGEVQESSNIQFIDEFEYTGAVDNWSCESSNGGNYFISVYNPYENSFAKSDDFLIKDIYVEVQYENETKKYELEKDLRSNSYNLELKKKDLIFDKYKIHLVAEYNNGLVKKYTIDEKI